MNYRRLGSAGLKVSELSLGAWVTYGYEWLKDSVVTPERIEKVRRLQSVATDLDCSMAQLALAWCLKNPNVSTVITGATRPEQVNENMKALDYVPELTSDVMDRIEGILGNKPKTDED